MRVLDLFSGIGGFSLGLERAGMQTVAFCETERYCRAVLGKHWPKVARFKDVRYLTTAKLKPFLPIDVISAGFPCQDVSQAGRKLGIEGNRSGLWTEAYRLIGELRPIYAIMENVSALLIRGVERVLGDLAALGYDAQWHCIPASHVGGIQERDRIWIIAYLGGERGQRLVESLYSGPLGQGWMRSEADLQSILDAPLEPGHSWPQPIVRGMDGRIRHRIHRMRALGNSVYPQIPEIIGKAILQAEGLIRPARQGVNTRRMNW